MAISLSKGGNLSLSKEAPGLNKITVGLGWDARVTDGSAFDLDAVAFLVNATGKVRSDADFVFYNQPKAGDDSVSHMGDNLTGEGDGDDEQLQVTLNGVPADVEKIAICVTIHEADTRKQNFGMVSNAFVRVVDDSNNKEIARYDLSEDMSMETAMTFAELYRKGNEWKFKAIGQGFSGGLGDLARSYGVNL